MTRTLAALLLLCSALPASTRAAAQAKPIKALMLVGGCCHDYKTMPGVLARAIDQSANIQFDIKLLTSAGEDAALLRNPHFADAYDVVVYDMCFGEKWKDGDYDGALATAKAGKPAVFVHCAMHTFRPPRDKKAPDFKQREAICDAKWHALVGMDTRVHDKYERFAVTKADKESPILKSWPDEWRTQGDELYNTIKMMPTATPLLQARSPISGSLHTVAWTNHYGETRVFGTTLGHDMKTGGTPEYQRLLAYGILWACDKLGADGKPLPGYAGQ
jgi:uncharacterized protein